MTIIVRKVVASAPSIMTSAAFRQRQSHRKVATQSYRSKERELYDSGTAGIELYVKELIGPLRDPVARERRGTAWPAVGRAA
jgi:hypothetical protein